MNLETDEVSKYVVNISEWFAKIEKRLGIFIDLAFYTDDKHRCGRGRRRRRRIEHTRLSISRYSLLSNEDNVPSRSTGGGGGGGEEGVGVHRTLMMMCVYWHYCSVLFRCAV
jgi:hypothetical protein